MTTAPQSPPTPTVPPAVAEFEALSPMGKALLVAARLVEEAEAAGIEVGSASAYPRTVGIVIHAADDRMTPALAVALGLTTRTVTERDRWTSTETFTSTRHGVPVTAVHTLPTAALAADEPVRSAS